MSDTLSSAFADTKPHYNILDGLRGVAALTVVCFHLFEAYATSHLDQKINHGYLAVDFFFRQSKAHTYIAKRPPKSKYGQSATR